MPRRPQPLTDPDDAPVAASLPVPAARLRGKPATWHRLGGLAVSASKVGNSAWGRSMLASQGGLRRRSLSPDALQSTGRALTSKRLALRAARLSNGPSNGGNPSTP